MTGHWLLLATLLLTNNVLLNFGAPADNHETTVNSRAPMDNHDTTVDSVAPAGSDKMSLNEADPNIQQRQRDTINNDSSWNTNNNGYNTWSVTTIKEGQCVQEISIKGMGVDDIFGFPCSVGNMPIHTSSEDILVAGKDTVQINSIYGKRPGQLQVIQEGKCSVRTYTTSNGNTTASSTPVAEAECDAMKKEHLERMQKWQKWEAETFPPCFPFCNTNKPGATAPQPSGSVTQYNNPWNANPFAGSSDVSQENLVPNQSFDQFLAAFMQMLNNYRGTTPSSKKV